MPNLAKKRKFGTNSTDTCRPVRAKALKYRAIYKAFALTGRLADCYYTQGDALGSELLPFQGVLFPGASALSGRAASRSF